MAQTTGKNSENRGNRSERTETRVFSARNNFVIRRVWQFLVTLNFLSGGRTYNKKIILKLVNTSCNLFKECESSRYSFLGTAAREIVNKKSWPGMAAASGHLTTTQLTEDLRLTGKELRTRKWHSSCARIRRPTETGLSGRNSRAGIRGNSRLILGHGPATNRSLRSTATRVFSFVISPVQR